MSNKPWCVMPFNQMSLKESGRYAVCCEAKESDITVTDMTPLEFFHSDYMNDISCLLYTSPSPRDVRSSRMPSSA